MGRQDRQQLEAVGLDEEGLAARSAAEAEGARLRAAILVDGFLDGVVERVGPDHR